MKKHFARIIAGVLPIALLGACATTSEETAQSNTRPDEAVEARTTAAEPMADASAEPAQASKAMHALQDTSMLPSRRIIFFDFDKSDLRSEYRTVIRAHAEYLADNPRIRVRLEGHADERGTRDYNIALGERRGHSVLASLALNGVSKDRIETVSYGEERPLTTGHDESSWQRNRRVEIVYE